MIDIAKGYSISNWPIYKIQNVPIQKEITDNLSQKSVWKKVAYPSIGFVLGAILMGSLAYKKSKKNIKFKYAAFAKDKIKEFLKLPEAKPYVEKIELEKRYYTDNINNPNYQEILKGNKYYNFITYFKSLKNTLAKKTQYYKNHSPENEDLLSMAEIEQAITKIKIILLNIEQDFINKNIEKTVNSCVKNSIIGGVIGSGLGICTNFLKGNKDEN